jgi:hypothetical protein
MKISFKTPKEIVVVKEVKITIEELIVSEIIDSPEMKEVKAIIDRLGIITLWQGEAYDKIGQWTDKDVESKLLELYK